MKSIGWSRGRRAAASDRKPVGMGDRVEWDHRVLIQVANKYGVPSTTYMSGRRMLKLVFGEQAVREKKKSMRHEICRSLEVFRE